MPHTAAGRENAQPTHLLVYPPNVVAGTRRHSLRRCCIPFSLERSCHDPPGLYHQRKWALPTSMSMTRGCGQLCSKEAQAQHQAYIQAAGPWRLRLVVLAVTLSIRDNACDDCPTRGLLWPMAP
jgi:hypothetical protein